MITAQRQKGEFLIGSSQTTELKLRMLSWAKQFSIHVFLDNNNYHSDTNGYECLLATGTKEYVSSNADKDALTQLQFLHDSRKDWLFGHISYDYKNILHSWLGPAPAADGFPLLHFFIPETVCYINKNRTMLVIESFQSPDLVFDEINSTSTVLPHQQLPHLQFTGLFDKSNYIAAVEHLRKHIADGDCYEINFCNKGYCEAAAIQPLEVFNALNAISPAPFAAYYRFGHLFMMCASPERYLKKDGQRIIAQPIKGTARRDKDKFKDIEIRELLRNDIKERAENVMIVDLMRNDLARSCEVGSVSVDELFGIYSYPQVHHLISTVSGILRPGVSFTDAIRYSFPMGSMTGAPKYKVMQLIEKYERCKRELFSGTIGYITPSGDFDFNVIIRSLFYNAATKYLHYQTGGAITYDSIPEQEWEEMRLKAWALEKIFA